MDDLQTVALEEFKQLRAEIQTRTTLGNQIFSYTVIALSAGLALLEKVPDILLGLSLLSCWLWLLWLDHTGQVFKIAHYIGVDLRRKLQFGEEAPLEWEYFLRRLDSEGVKLQDGSWNIDIPGTGATLGYAAILFAGTAPVLLAIYWFTQMRASPVDDLYRVRLVGMVLVIAVWIFAVFRARALSNMKRSIDAAILLAGAAHKHS